MEKAIFCPHCNFLPYSFSFCLPPPPLLPPPSSSSLFLPSHHHPSTLRTKLPQSIGVNGWFVFQRACVYIGRGRKDEQGCFGLRERWQRHVSVCLSEASGSHSKHWRGEKRYFPDLQMCEELCFEFWLKHSRTSTCLRMWSDPSVYSTGNSTRTCWAFFLFLQQCERGSGLREFPVHLIQPQHVQSPNPTPHKRSELHTWQKKK